MTIEQGKARKRPVEIEYFKWDGQPPVEWPAWARDSLDIRYEISCLYIDTLEGTHRANRGDYILKGVKGELYPCKPDIFQMTYDKID